MDSVELSMPSKPSTGFDLKATKPLKRGKFGQLVTFFASKKNNASVACETLLEADFCFHLERRADIYAYRSQPFIIQLTDEGISYTPDFLARRLDGSAILFEIKNASSEQSPTWQHRRIILEQAFRDRQITFTVVGEAEIRPKVEIDNLRYLYHIGFEGDHHTDQQIENLLRAQADKYITIAELLRLGAAEQAVAHALFYRRIQADLSHPINMASAVWRNS